MATELHDSHGYTQLAVEHLDAVSETTNDDVRAELLAKAQIYATLATAEATHELTFLFQGPNTVAQIAVVTND